MEKVLSLSARARISAANKGKNKRIITPEVAAAVLEFEKTLPAGYRAIPLDKGYMTVVDEADYDKLMLQTWSVQMRGNNGPYAIGYVWTAGKTKSYQMARVILGLETGDDRQADHAQHFTNSTLYNCRTWNGEPHLRIVTPAQNNQNASKKKSKSTSKYKGVSAWSVNAHQYWRAQIQSDGKPIYLGSFPFNGDGEELAALQYNYFAKLNFGEHALLNDIQFLEAN